MWTVTNTQHIDDEDRRGIIRVTTPLTTNYVEPPFDLIELRAHRKASVAKEENKPLRAEQTEERGPWAKQE